MNGNSIVAFMLETSVNVENDVVDVIEIMVVFVSFIPVANQPNDISCSSLIQVTLIGNLAPLFPQQVIFSRVQYTSRRLQRFVATPVERENFREYHHGLKMPFLWNWNPVPQVIGKIVIVNLCALNIL